MENEHIECERMEKLLRETIEELEEQVEKIQSHLDDYKDAMKQISRLTLP